MSEDEFKTKDAQEIHEISKVLPELLDTVSEKVPALLRNLIRTVFSEEAGRDLGKAVAGFYQELKASGMPEQLVNEVMREYVNIQGGVLSGVAKSGFRMNEVVKTEAAKAETGKPEGE